MTQPLAGYHDAVSTFKREYLSQMLLAHSGNRTRTARTLRLQRTYFLRLLRGFGLSQPGSRKPDEAPVSK